MPVIRQIAQQILSIWSKFGMLLNRICSPLILGMVYFLLLTPVALLYRLFTAGREKDNATSFTERNKLFTAKDFENPW